MRTVVSFSIVSDRTASVNKNARRQPYLRAFFGWDQSNGPASTASITNVDTSWNVIDMVTKPYGLVNDAVYYPVDDTILISGSNTGYVDWLGKIIKLNATDFSVIDSYDSGVDVPYQIEYDPINSLIYVAGRETTPGGDWQMAILDTSFNVLKQYPLANVTIPPYTDSGAGFTYEGSCMFNGQFMIQSCNNDRLILSSYNLQDVGIKNYIVVPKPQNVAPESAFIKGDYLHIVSYQDNTIIVDKYDLKEIGTLAYTDGQIGFYHQQTVEIDRGDPETSGTARVEYFARNITFVKGLNVIEVREPGTTKVEGAFIVAANTPLYYSGIFFGYYNDYVFRITRAGSTYTAHQLTES